MSWLCGSAFFGVATSLAAILPVGKTTMWRTIVSAMSIICIFFFFFNHFSHVQFPTLERIRGIQRVSVDVCLVPTPHNITDHRQCSAVMIYTRTVDWSCSFSGFIVHAWRVRTRNDREKDVNKLRTLRRRPHTRRAIFQRLIRASVLCLCL